MMLVVRKATSSGGEKFPAGSCAVPTAVSNIVINTSAVATDTIDYVATDTWGNTATTTRTVIVEAMATSSP